MRSFLVIICSVRDVNNGTFERKKGPLYAGENITFRCMDDLVLNETTKATSISLICTKSGNISSIPICKKIGKCH